MNNLYLISANTTKGNVTGSVALTSVDLQNT